ncbi:MAG: MazG nucleotide pyrophosphohydrolase domain-containing protein [Gammaproteobacteria bacterium]
MDTLEKLAMLEREATDFGFKWGTHEQIMAQIRSELSEVEVHLKDKDADKLQEEIGDILHAVFSLCIFCQADPKRTLTNSVNKFERRFNAVKQIVSEQKLKSLNGKSFDELMFFWDKAKELVG